jgi:hypothetical protein
MQMQNCSTLEYHIRRLYNCGGSVTFRINNYHIKILRSQTGTYFEALPENGAGEKFHNLGFVSVSGKYYKTLNSSFTDEQLNRILSDSKVIFEECYKVSYATPFSVKEEIQKNDEVRNTQNERQSSSSTYSSKNNSALKYKKVLFYIVGSILLFSFFSNLKSGSIYGRYDLVTSGEFKEILDKANAYIVLEKDGTIILHSEALGSDVHRVGRFIESEGESVTSVETNFNDGRAPYSIQVEDGDLVIGASTYRK